MKLKIEVKTCSDCPFYDCDREYGYSSCLKKFFPGYSWWARFSDNIFITWDPDEEVYKDCELKKVTFKFPS